MAITTKDLVWLVVVVSVGIACWFGGRKAEQSSDTWRLRAGTLERIAKHSGWRVRWTDKTVDVNTGQKVFSVEPKIQPSDPVYVE